MSLALYRNIIDVIYITSNDSKNTYLAKLTNVKNVVSKSCVMISGPSILIKGILKRKKINYHMLFFVIKK